MPIDVVPCAGIKPLPTYHRTRYLTDEEYASIYQRASELIQIIMELCYRTGQRIGDVRRIKLSDLTDKGIMFLQGKTGARVCAEWTPELRAATDRAKALMGDDNVVPIKGKDERYLMSARGGVALSYDAILAKWCEAVADAKIEDAHLHDLRAKAATDKDREHGLAEASKLMGHTTQGKTQIYIRERRTSYVQGPTNAGAR